MNISEVSSLKAPTALAEKPAENPELRRLAQEFEAQFIAEMLKHTGLNEASSGFGGGAGEAAFSSFLTDAYAQELVQSGGVGLAESIYQAMLAKGE